MTKQKSTKRALLLSALSLLMCVSMLIGSTFAWFTDSVISGNNKIVAGNLDIELEYYNGTEWKTVNGATNLFDETLWEPGHTEVVYLKLSNLGSLALKYQLGINIVSETTGINVDGKTFKLSDYIYMGVVEDQQPSFENRVAAKAAVAGKSGIISTGYTKSGSMLKDAADLYLAVVVYMPETVGNEANYKSGTSAPEIDLGINLLATQYTDEEDSFGNDYDADATFGTYIELNAGEDLLAAMASAEKDMPLTIKLMGDVEWPTDGHHGENDITPASSIVIDGNGYTITAIGSGVTPLGDVEAPMTLKNVTIVDNSVSYDESAWELSYLEMGGRVLNCVNVDFVDPITVDSDKATFNGCTFVGHNDKNSTTTTQYGVWVTNGDATFTDCTFTGTRGLKICDKYAPEVGTVVVDGCTFKDISEKPGIAIDDEDTLDMNIIIKNSLFINCQAGDQGLYIYETDDTVPTLENNKVFNNATVVSSAEEMKNALNTTGDINIVITEDIAVKDGSLVHTHNSTQDITINGNGATIESSASSVDAFQWEGGTIPAMSTIFSSADGSKVTVNDLSFTGTMSAIMLGHYQNATYNKYNTVLNNVNVIGANVVSFSANTAPAVCVYGTATLNNCNIYGTTLSELDTDPMWPVYDLAAVNYTDLTVNDSKIGSLLMWNQAKVTVADGTEVDTVVVRGNMNTTKYGLTIEAGATVGAIDLSGITNKAKINITIEDGANVGKIIANGVEYATLADWQNA